MIEKLVRNWLTSTTERKYLPQLIQALILDGYTILHVSSHGPLEQGKDIICRDPNGQLLGIQTKTGTLKTGEWTRYGDEFRTLSQLAINHPDRGTDEIHEAIIVTNGKVTASFMHEMTAYNSGSAVAKGYHARLSYWDIEKLTSLFTNWATTATSDNPQYVLELLAEYTSDPAMSPNISRISKLLQFESDSAGPSRADLLVGCMMAYLAISRKANADNHYAIIVVATLCASHIQAWMEVNPSHRRGLDSLVEQLIDDALAASELILKEATATPNLLQGDLITDGGFVLKQRTKMVLAVCAVVAVERISIRDQFRDLCKQYIHSIEVFSEYDYGHVALIHLGSSICTGSSDIWITFVKRAFVELTKSQTLRGKDAIPGLYARPEEFVMLAAKEGRDVTSNAQGVSWILDSLLYHLAAVNDKETVSDVWRKLHNIELVRYNPDHWWDLLQPHATSGAVHSLRFQRKESWSLLRQHYATIQYPQLMQHRTLVLLLILICPYRFSRHTMPIIESYLTLRPN